MIERTVTKYQCPFCMERYDTEKEAENCRDECIYEDVEEIEIEEFRRKEMRAWA